MKKTSLGIIAGAIMLLVGVLAFGYFTQSSSMTGGSSYDALSGEAIEFKSSNCGCCGIYAQYAKKEGLDITVKEVADINAIKDEFNIPAQVRSCHTVKIGDYYVEGHVPSEAISKLLSEKPDIAGIALPGMPAGSPGMGGVKNKPWVIYAVNHDGSYEEFMTL